MKRSKQYLEGLLPNVGKAWEEVATPEESKVELSYPFQGLNLKQRRSNLEAGETPVCKNARLHKGYIGLRPGADLVWNGFDSTVMYVKEFVQSDGDVYTIVLTTKSLYYSTDLFASVRTRAYYPYTVGTVDVSGTAVTMATGTTAWDVNVRAGDRMGFSTTDPSAVVSWYTIDTVGGATSITLTADAGSLSGVTYVIDRYFGGNEGYQFWSVTWPQATCTGYGSLTTEDAFIFDQGYDPVMFWNASDGYVYRVDRTNVPAAACGMQFADRLFIGNVTSYPYRVKHSAANLPFDFTSTGAGYKDTIEDPYDITGFSEISGVGLIYKTYSIMTMTRTGIASDPIDYKMKVPGIGCYLPGTLNSFGDEDVFWGSDNVYTYDLRSVKAIGDNIKDSIFGIIDPNYATRAHSMVIEEFGEYITWYPENGYAYPNRAIVYSYDMDSWSSIWDRPARSSGYATQVTGVTIDSSTGTIDSHGAVIDSSTLSSSYPLSMIGYGTSLFKLNPDSDKDDDLADPYYFLMEWQTKDVILNKRKNQTLYRATLSYECTAACWVYVAVSMDGGNTWSDEAAVSLVRLDNYSGYAPIDFLHTGRSHCIRVRARWGGQFKILGVIFDLIEGGDLIPEYAAIAAPAYSMPTESGESVTPPTPPDIPTPPPTPPVPPTPPPSTPVITSLSPSSGVVLSKVTINGSNFGASRVELTDYVLIGGYNVVIDEAAEASVTAWTNTAIQIIIPTGLTAGPWGVTVTTSGGTSNTVKFEVVGETSVSIGDFNLQATLLGSSIDPTTHTWCFCDVGSGVVVAGTEGGDCRKGYGGRIYRSTNRGTSWSYTGQVGSSIAADATKWPDQGPWMTAAARDIVKSPYSGKLVLIQSAYWAAVEESFIFTSTDLGLTWTVQYLNDDSQAVSICYTDTQKVVMGSAPTNLYSFGYGGTVVYSEDDAVTWSRKTVAGLHVHEGVAHFCNLGGGRVLAGVSYTPPSIGQWVAGRGGKIAYSSDYGKTWAATSQQYSQTNIYDICYIGQDQWGNYVALAGTANYYDWGDVYYGKGKILRSTSTSLSTLGSTWTDVGLDFFSGESGMIRCFANLGSGVVLAGTGDGKNPSVNGGCILISSDYGLTWRKAAKLGDEKYILSLKTIDGTAGSTRCVLAGTYPNSRVYKLIY